LRQPRHHYIWWHFDRLPQIDGFAGQGQQSFPHRMVDFLVDALIAQCSQINLSIHPQAGPRRECGARCDNFL
jgi:hypothetical protein